MGRNAVSAAPALHPCPRLDLNGASDRARCLREHAVLGSISPGVRKRCGIRVERTGTNLGIGSSAAVWAQGPEMLPGQIMSITLGENNLPASTTIQRVPHLILRYSQTGY